MRRKVPRNQGYREREQTVRTEGQREMNMRASVGGRRTAEASRRGGKRLCLSEYVARVLPRRRWAVGLAFCALLCGAMWLGHFNTDAAEDTSLCTHHYVHNESCGYVAEADEQPCGHKHGEDCYRMEQNCLWDGASATQTDVDHRCSEESGCIVPALQCSHVHDEQCGYVAAAVAAPCRFDCPCDYVCICPTPCEPGHMNTDCPVCGHRLAMLSDCTLIEGYTPVTHWQWADGAVSGNLLMLPAPDESLPYEARLVPCEQVLELLPTQIIANSRLLLDLTWQCADYPAEGACEGVYMFTAQMPETYLLSKTALPLSVSVAFDEPSRESARYISQLRLAVCTAQTMAQTRDALAYEGFGMLTLPLFAAPDGTSVYIAYKTTDDVRQAVRSIALFAPEAVDAPLPIEDMSGVPRDYVCVDNGVEEQPEAYAPDGANTAAVADTADEEVATASDLVKIDTVTVEHYTQTDRGLRVEHMLYRLLVAYNDPDVDVVEAVESITITNYAGGTPLKELGPTERWVGLLNNAEPCFPGNARDSVYCAMSYSVSSHRCSENDIYCTPSIDEDYHSAICSICDRSTGLFAHSYTDNCGECSLCGATRTPVHTYADPCDTECCICGGRRSLEHPWDDDGFCVLCGTPRPADAVEGVYQINSAGNLCWFSAYVNASTENGSADAVLGANIDLSGCAAWIPIGRSRSLAYRGDFDGAEFVITGLSGQNGLFGYAEGGKISRLGLEDVSVSGSGGTVGALVGNCAARVERCYAIGTVSGGGTVGGLVGALEGGTLKNAYAAVSVSGTEQGAVVDPLCGSNSGTVEGCCYLSGTEDGSGGLTAEQFASGEATWRLNGGTLDNGLVVTPALGTGWGQRLDGFYVQEFPSFADRSVYRHQSGIYSNDQEIYEVTVRWGATALSYGEDTQWNADSPAAPDAGNGQYVSVDNQGTAALDVTLTYTPADRRSDRQVHGQFSTLDGEGETGTDTLTSGVRPQSGKQWMLSLHSEKTPGRSVGNDGGITVVLNTAGYAE